MLQIKLQYSQCLLHKVADVGFRMRSEKLINGLPALKHHQKRNAVRSVLRGKLRILVHVQLGDLQPSRVLVRELFQRRRNHATWPAPYGPKINEHGLVAVQHLLVKIRLIYRYWMVGGLLISAIFSFGNARLWSTPQEIIGSFTHLSRRWIVQPTLLTPIFPCNATPTTLQPFTSNTIF